MFNTTATGYTKAEARAAFGAALAAQLTPGDAPAQAAILTAVDAQLALMTDEAGRVVSINANGQLGGQDDGNGGFNPIRASLVSTSVQLMPVVQPQV